MWKSDRRQFFPTSSDDREGDSRCLFQAILAGDFILSAASMALARIGDITVVKVLSQVIEDLVRGTVVPLSGSSQCFLQPVQLFIVRDEVSHLKWVISVIGHIRTEPDKRF